MGEWGQSAYTRISLESAYKGETVRYPWANTVLLALLIVQLGTGLAALLSGTAAFRWVLWFHALGGYALALVLVWKGRIVWGVLLRRRLTAARLAFLGMTGLLLATLATGFHWSTLGPSALFGFSTLVVHGALAVLLLALLVWHVVVRRWIFRVPRARDRRALLRGVAASLAGLAGWQLADRVRGEMGLPGRAQRFTGSYEQGSFTGRFPAVSWLFDAPHPLALDGWHLTVTGIGLTPLTLSLEDLLALPQQTITATLDCTGGWYTIQEWQGVRVADVVALAGLVHEARSITVASVTGYRRRFPLAALEGYVLATHVNGELLSHGHGAPLRLVAPGRRGYDWVKWVTALHLNESAAWRQAPLPLQ